MFCMWVQAHGPCQEISSRKNGDAVSWREHTNKLLISDVQGHVPERCGHGAHHTVVIYSEQLHEDGQAFLFPDSSSDVY